MKHPIISTKTRIITALLLAFCLIFAAGCSSATAPLSETTNSITSKPIVSESSASAIEKRDFGGREFKVLAIDVERTIPNEIYVESEIGEILSDSIYQRNAAVEEVLNVKIVPLLGVSRNEIPTEIRKLVMSADAMFDMAMPSFGALIQLLRLEGALVKIDDISTLNTANEWWDQNSIDAFSIRDVGYVIGGALNLNTMMATYGLLFNKSIVENLGLDSPYEMVRDGSWVIDKMAKMMAATTSDLNGDGIMDDSDRYGLMATTNSLKYLLLGTGAEIIVKDSDDIPVLNTSERLYTAVERILPVAHERYQPDMYTTGNSGLNIFFSQDKVLFFQQSLQAALELRGMETDFGIIPSPKLDESQDRYYSPLAASRATMVMVPATNTQLDETGYIIDALGAYSLEYIVPAFYDVTITGKVMRDKDSGDMLEIMTAARLYVLNDVFNFGSSNSIFSRLTQSGINDFASQVAAAEKAINAGIESLLGME